MVRGRGGGERVQRGAQARAGGVQLVDELRLVARRVVRVRQHVAQQPRAVQRRAHLLRASAARLAATLLLRNIQPQFTKLVHTAPCQQYY